MINYSVPLFITVLNILIEWKLFKSFIVYKHSDRMGINRLLFELTRLLLIANTFALVTGVIDYFILHSTTADVLQFGRFADRYVMFFAYWALSDYSKRHNN